MDFQPHAEGFKSGFVTLVGRPNAGKSTLINAIMGKKIAITSDTAQTTRHRFRAVLTREDFQLILVDTPGLHKPHDALGEELNTSALKALEDVDVVAMLIDASQPIGRGDEWVAEQLSRVRSKKICVLSKLDLATEKQISAQREAAEALGAWDAMVGLSPATGKNVERDSQKGIIIGKKGAAIKQIGTEARADLEQLLGTRVYLDLSVKVKKNWRRDASQIRRFGYGEGA